MTLFEWIKSILNFFYGFDVPSDYRDASFHVDSLSTISDPELKLAKVYDWKVKNFDNVTDDKKWELGLWVERQVYRTGVKVGFISGFFLAAILGLIFWR